MFTIKRQFGTFDIWTKDECPHKYVHWKEAKPNEYALSDDGYISICIKEEMLGKRVIKVFPYGKVTGNMKLNFEVRYLNKAYDLSEKSANERNARRSSAKRFVQAYIKMFMSGKIDWDKLGIIFNPNELIPKASAKRLFKNKWIKEMIDQGLTQELTDRGIDKGFYLDRITEAIEIARAKKDAANMLRAAEMIGEILVVKPNHKLLPIQEIGFNVIDNLKDIVYNEEKLINGQQTDSLQIKE